MKATQFTAAIFLAALVSSPYLVHANEPAMSTEAAYVVADADRSGNISAEEFTDYLHSMEGSDVPRVHRDFSMIDLNKDSVLTLEEFQVGEDMYPLAFR